MKFKTQYNEHEFPARMESTDKPSMTVPDQGLTIQELLRRHAKGLPLDGRDKLYDEEEEDNEFWSIDVSNMDLAEKEEFARQAKDEVERLRAILNQKAAVQREKDKEAAKDKQRKEWEESQKASDEPIKRAGGKPDQSTNVT